MTDDLAALAGKLSEGQRRMVLTNDRGFAEHAKGKWHAMHAATSKRLFALGLIESPDTLSQPTPLGLRLRTYLENQPCQTPKL